MLFYFWNHLRYLRNYKGWVVLLIDAILFLEPFKVFKKL
jgi:hypothetical protein